MADISFYQLTQGSLEKSVAKLLEKVYLAGLKSVLFFETNDALEIYNKLLWTFSSKTFLPHGSSKEGQSKEQPLWLTTIFENPNEADVLAYVEGSTISDFANFKRCLDIFNGHDDYAVTGARKRWKAYKEAGHTLTYWKQNEKGRWEKQNI
tara:strand:+ start:2467 stop:2919 length:453 start_codon:yes stop_codon:yes gene_type:complete